MKTKSISLLALVLLPLLSGFSIVPPPSTNTNTKMISFYVRGNGKSHVELGIGAQVGTGSCCRGVSKDTTVGFTGEVGDVLYDGKTRRVITKVYAEMEGKTIDLRQYY